MKCGLVALITCVGYAASQYMIMNKQPKSSCDSSANNALVEHFYNIIFSEFHNTPPVCVCVQMCAGQSTYCYPNGCLKRDDLMSVDSPQSAPHYQGDKKQYMFVVDEKKDFMKDFLEKSYSDETLSPTPNKEIRDMRPDVFKDKYSMLLKHKKMPSVELRYNLREQVKNMKSDLLKLEGVDLSKTRWPMNKRNLISGHKSHSKIEKRAPLVGKANFFMAMLPANDVAEYPPKYFKRDIARTLNDDEAKLKAFYLLENSDTENNANETISLETLIENLINNSFQTKSDNIKKETENSFTVRSIDSKDKTDNISQTKPVDTNDKKDLNITAESKIEQTKVAMERALNMNETMNVMSMNLTNEKVDKNKYTKYYVSNSTNSFNDMIISLSKRIEKQNNTSMEIVKRLASDFEGEEVPFIKTETTKSHQLSSFIKKEIEPRDIEITKQTPTPADFTETKVTRKNKHRRARRLQNIKGIIQ